MDFELRSVLLIVGVVVIAAILIHGLIGIRRANKPIDISHINLNETDEQGDLLRDGSGFDRHGVGVARKKEHSAAEELSADAQLDVGNDDSSETQLDLALGEQSEEIESGINFSVALEADGTDSVLGDVQTSAPSEAPVFESPIVQEKEEYLEPRVGVMEVTSDYHANDNDNQADTDAGVDIKVDTASTPAAQQPEPMDVLVLNVVASDNQEISGAVLLPTLLTLGLKFGDMDIFHRHQHASGKGDVLFSLVNMVKPGTFDVDNMEQFTTTGISLFMTIPHLHGNMETFNMMLNAAAKIAETFDGQVLDGDRSTLTNQSTQHYVQRIREVERKLLLRK